MAAASSVDGLLEAGYSLWGNSTRNDSGSSVRGSGYPVKRYPAAGRPVSTNGDSSNSGNMEENVSDFCKVSGQHSVKSNRGLAGRSIKLEGDANSKGRSCICSILISVALCCFLAEVILQGSIMMLWKQTEVSKTLENIKPTDFVEESERYTLEYKIRFDPWKLKSHARQQRHMAARMKMPKQAFLRSPYLALVCANLYVSPDSLYMITIAKWFQALGYDLQLFSYEGGPLIKVWEEQGVSVERLDSSSERLNIDWSKFEGVVLCSLDIKHVFTSFLQEPFKATVVIWIVLEDTLGRRLSLYEKEGALGLINEWKKAFARADVVVFPHHSSAMMHASLDTGNFLVVPGNPKDIWDVKSYMKQEKRDNVRISLGFSSRDIVLTVVGSPFTYKGVWREHAMIMKAVLPVLEEINETNRKAGSVLRLIFIGSYSRSSYDEVVKVMAAHLGLSSGTVSYFNDDSDNCMGMLWAADVVIYSSLREEQEFPGILLQAIALERAVLAPNLTFLQDFMLDGSGSNIYPAGDINSLSERISQSILRHSSQDEAINLAGLTRAMTLLARGVFEAYADLFESFLIFPSGTKLPRRKTEISSSLTGDWQWKIITDIKGFEMENFLIEKNTAVSHMVATLERQLNATSGTDNKKEVEDYGSLTRDDWEEEKAAVLLEDLEMREEEQVEERRELLRGSWEDAYKVVKKMERLKNTDLHERDDGELERTGQPLCIYEPYHGTGAGAFVHQNDPLYRGVSLLPRQRRSGHDDIDAAARLPLLNDTYYQEVFCDYGAFLAIANHIDRVHKNPWIGFQSWKASGRKASLSTEAEKILKDAVKTGKHGEAFYFWGHIPEDESIESLHQDFWSYCDLINDNSCRPVFLDVFKTMYGLPSAWASLPPMPIDGGKWSALHCWAMRTSSFVEFIMFARMFIDALDWQRHTEHYDGERCFLGVSESEVKHCYCRMLELLVNVWAYHSARIMIYVDPKTGVMHEQHPLDGRKGHIWVKYFMYSTLKSMDEDLAEEFDDGQHGGRLWPQTGEVYCQGMFERERQAHINQRLERKKKNKERLKRIQSRYRQKPLAGG